MSKFKISIHCGQTSAFVIEEYPTKQEALSRWSMALDSSTTPAYLSFGDVLVNTAQISFLVAEELIEKPVEPEAQATIEA